MSEPAPPVVAPPPRRRLWLVALPLVVFLALAALFLARLETGGDPSRVPSVLVGRKAPAISLPPLADLRKGGASVPGIDTATLTGKPTLVNVWASWCGPCREEHPLLMKLAQDPRLRLVGLNYKDAPENARRFLGQYGLPYAAVGVDPNGRAAIEWGVYGVPETFVLAPDGTVAHKFVGPLTPEAVNGTLLPLIAKLSAP
ncbi:DsbE family thiol:disulfide interchange protein [Xanthobacter sp. KR7-225]|uniref:DsbE family thiol:disulfide interchange protein n=1 Tax=Xanthobacter sp. KR7-225 TaxID=3156613 RepID=UPI0032B56D9C